MESLDQESQNNNPNVDNNGDTDQAFNNLL